MSKAAPSWDSNMEKNRLSGSRLAVGANPRLPARAAARSDKFSARRFCSHDGVKDGRLSDHACSHRINGHFVLGDFRRLLGDFPTQSRPTPPCRAEYSIIVLCFKRGPFVFWASRPTPPPGHTTRPKNCVAKIQKWCRIPPPISEFARIEPPCLSRSLTGKSHGAHESGLHGASSPTSSCFMSSLSWTA